jgi:hypothetical protein
MSCVEIEGVVVCCKNKIHKKEGKIKEGKSKVDCQVIN